MITSWNKAAERIFGYSSDEALGRHISLITPESHRGEELAILETIRQGSALKHYQTERRTKDGRQINVSVTASPMRDAAGNVIGASKIYRDLSEQERAEQELRIAAAAFEANQAMMVTDANNIILRVNQAFTLSTGYSAAEVVGRHVRLLNSGRQNPDFYAQMWATILRDGSWQGEIWNRRKNGEVYPEWLTITSVKDLDGQTTNYVGIHTDITERKAAEEAIRNLAYYDSLTHLPNRRLLLDCLHQAQVSCARLERLGALIFIDLDNFKTLNDTQGHDKGDLLLKEVAQRLRECVREGDTVSRLGGDEFVIIAENLSGDIDEAAHQAEIVSEKILAAFKRSYSLEGPEFHCTASIGLTLFGHKPETMEVLMMQADFAMYQAKAGGRNAYRFFDPVMQAAVTARNLLEKELRQAVREAEFVLYYQAQVDGEGRLVGAEALVRWQHGQRGIIEPDDFIPLAEETGLIRPLGHAVLAAACTQLAAWAQRPATARLTVAVNISVREFGQPNFAEQVLAILTATGANPQRLTLELTESLLIADVGDVIAKMRALKRAGVGFALDDFGTGNSSLAYLNQLPLDQLKIDRSFVMNIESDASAALICAATINLAHSLNLQVVAEGVETATQRHVLSKVHRCDFMQGYLFSSPLPLEAFEAFAAQRAASAPAA